MTSKSSRQSRQKNASPKRYDGVVFRFYHPDDNVLLNGSVIVRANKMVIDICDPDSESPYLIDGELHENFYSGTNSAVGGTSEVAAKWAKLGNIYVGLWIELGSDYLFSFELIKEGTNPR